MDDVDVYFATEEDVAAARSEWLGKLGTTWEDIQTRAATDDLSHAEERFWFMFRPPA